MKKIAVVLSGCGFKDGTEITEAVGTMIALSELNVDIACFAPNQEVASVNHGNDQSQAPRNMMTESQRLTRGACKDLKELNEKQFDALIFPGGFGAALNLSDWGVKASQCTLLPDIESIISNFYNASKPIGAMCIAPVLLAKVLGKKGVTLTIGNDKETAEEIEKTGALHEQCEVTDYITDRESKVVTTPAYMYGEASPHEVFLGIRGMVKETVEMA